jgi:hypothetical protein
VIARGWGGALVWLLGLSAAPQADVRREVAPPDRPVEFGAAFEWTLTRCWRQGLVPDPFDAAVVAPLVVVDVEETRQVVDGEVRQLLRLNCHAFEAGELVVVLPPFVAEDPATGATVQTGSTPLRFEIASALDPDEPGDVELPGDVLEPPPRRGPWLVGGLAAVLTLAVLVLLRRRSRIPQGAPAPDAEATARDRLARCAEQRRLPGHDPRRTYCELARLVEELVAVRAPTLPGDAVNPATGGASLAARLRALDAAALAVAFARAERVQYAGEAVSAEELDALCAAVEAWIAAPPALHAAGVAT